MVVLELAEAHTAVTPRERKPTGGTGDGHIEETALLLDIALLHCHLRGEEVLLHAHDKYGRELQPLGRMYGHECDGGHSLGVVGILVGEQGYVLQILRKQHRTTLLLIVCYTGRDVVHERLQILLPLAVFGFSPGVDFGHKPRLAQHAQGQGVGPLGGHQCTERGHELGEALELALRGGIDIQGVGRRFGYDLEGGDCMVDGGEEHFVQCCLTDAASRIVDDAAQSFLVVWIDGQPQIGQCVLHLLALVEGESAVDAVGIATSLEFILEGLALAVGAIQDGHVAVVVSLVLQFVDFSGYDGGFLLFAIGLAYVYGSALFGKAVYVLVYLSLVVVYDAVGRPDDGLGGTVVLFEFE